MVKIKGWKKFNDITWKSEITGALVQVVPERTSGFTNPNRNDKRIWSVYVESRNPPKHKRVKIPYIKEKKIAMKNAISWMKKHPRG